MSGLLLTGSPLQIAPLCNGRQGIYLILSLVTWGHGNPSYTHLTMLFFFWHGDLGPSMPEPSLMASALLVIIRAIWYILVINCHYIVLVHGEKFDSIWAINSRIEQLLSELDQCGRLSNSYRPKNLRGFFKTSLKYWYNCSSVPFCIVDVPSPWGQKGLGYEQSIKDKECLFSQGWIAFSH
jgi:hypothetical protein